jgi:hypothetical protein
MPFIVWTPAKAVDRGPRPLEEKPSEFASGYDEKSGGAKLHDELSTDAGE